MKRMIQLALVFGIAAGIGAGPASAEKPEWAGQGKGQGKGHGKGSDHAKHASKHFSDQHHAHVRTYYDNEFRGGHCPPGLSKKNNGCMPPGQAKKWRMGQSLPATVVVYDVPRPLVVKLGVPPEGYKYVRVASDILMIAIGTKIVVDAINDLGRI